MLSIRARLTLWYTAVLCVVLFAFGVGVVWVQQRFGRSQFDSELEAISSTMRSVMLEELDERHDLRHAAGETHKSVNVPARAVAILDASGVPLAAHWHGFPRATLPPLKEAPAFMTIGNGGNLWRVHITKAQSPFGPYYVVSAGETAELARQRRLLVRTLLVATPFALLFSGAVCWWAASRALRPVTLMASEAEAITAQSAGARLSEGDAGDELQQLARAFNRLLSRLATALQTQRQFMADASHELRTPISVAKTAADVMLSRPRRGEPEYRDALAIVGEQTTRLGRIVEDMLVLARADAGGFPVQRAPVPLDDVVAETVHAMRVIAQCRGVHLHANIEPNVTAIGDERLLRQLAGNLIDNAIKHTPREGSVDVSLWTDGAARVIAVADTGCGIPPADRDRVFERFVRLDPARDGRSGAGLGLPIARWIAQLHGGSLTLDGNARGGCTFVARLYPASTTSADRALSTGVSASAAAAVMS